MGNVPGIKVKPHIFFRFFFFYECWELEFSFVMTRASAGFLAGRLGTKNNNNDEKTQDRGDSKQKEKDGKPKKDVSEEDKLRMRYYESYPIPLHSHGIFYKRNEAIIGSGAPSMPKCCHQQNSNLNRAKKLSVVKEENDE